MGNPVHSRPGSIASPAIACLTAPTAPDPSTRLPNRPTESHRPGPRLSSPAYCPADPAPAPLPRTAIGAPNDNQRPPPAPFIGIERGPSRPTALTPCSNPKAAPHRWIRAYLWLDALTQKVREDGRIVNVSVVVATAVNGEGKREIIGMDVGTSEDGAFWLAFLRSLSAKGLSGVELVVSDAHQGLRGAIAAVFGGASWQRCRTHFMTNLLTRVPRRTFIRW